MRREKAGKRIYWYWLSGGAASLLGVVLLLLACYIPGFGEWYARHIFPVFPYTLGRLFSPLPFSLLEFCLLAVLLAALGGLVFLLTRLLIALVGLLRRRRWAARPSIGWKKILSRLLPRLFCGAGVVFLLLVLNCGINYHRDTFARQAGFDVGEYSPEELWQLYQLLTAEAEILRSETDSDETGGFRLSQGQSAASRALSLPALTAARPLIREAGGSMTALSGDYPGLIKDYPNAKPVFFSRLMSRLQLAGLFSSFTMEANYNRDMPDQDIPFTLCHELAHVSGFAREEEANFIAYLACLRSDSPDFRYSARYHALSYVLNALSRQLTAEEYAAAYGALPAGLRRDFAYSADYWRRFRGKTSEIYQRANDYFLKANGQREGMRSYGRMVDLLLAYYKERGQIGG
ncbi:MAG: DUF3810 domain-containing protein [Peptococcaceae bacterium]|jgi:hypothetical protein|nr:DUF3810 domain-containing protein [Peptococcaceae bacterium]